MANQGERGATYTTSTFTIETFDPKQNKWARWVKRLEVAFTVFEVPERLKLHYLLHYMGSDTYNTLCDKLAPEVPEDKEYNFLVITMDEFSDPVPLEIAETFRFQSRRQQEGETVSEFLHALQKLAINCKFGNFLKTALRNQFVYGLHARRIQSRLLETRDLTLEKAVDIAVSMEVSERDANELHKNNNCAVNLVTPKNKFRNNVNDNYNGNPNNNNIQNKNTKYNTGRGQKCFRCGSPDHLANTCNKPNLYCKFCKTRGHLQKVCTKASRALNTNEVEELQNAYDIQEILDIELEGENLTNRDKYILKLQIDQKPIVMEVDSGAAVSLINFAQYKKLFINNKLQNTKLKLVSYCKTQLEVLGFVRVTINYQGVDYAANLYVVQGDRNALLGREWIRILKINLQDIDNIHLLKRNENIYENNADVSKLISKYKHIFEPGVGTIKGVQASIYLKDNVKPIFIKARTVPFALQPAVEKEIDSLVQQGILEKVNSSDWATPVVPVIKKNNQIRLCGDYKVTLNPNILIDDHPLPTIDELFSKMAGGTKFTKIDLSKAYLHLEVKPEMRHLLTLNTHKGLYRPTRLMFGIASAPAIWQRQMEQILQDIPGCSVFLDDIKVTGPDLQTHLERLDLVFKKLSEHDLKVNIDKSVFLSDEIEYCGYKINKNGILKVASEIDAISEIPIPENKTQVRAFIGLINYYRRFFKNASTILYPLNNLLKDDVPFKWTRECQNAFDAAKTQIHSDQILCHYDPNLPLILATDASPLAVGAVLSHVFPDGSERPIQFASQTLTKTQQKYSQIDKEAYSLIFGVKKFYQYLCGNKFTLFTDHKPLIHIFSPSKSLPLLSATRMQHYAIFLQAFQYDIKYKSTGTHGNADALSRLPLTSEDLTIFDEPDVFEISQIETLPVTVDMLASATAQDVTLNKLLKGLRTGKIIPSSERFNVDQTEFTLQSGCIMRGQRVLIPVSLRGKILAELHSAHFGIVKMKGLARSYCWWPGVDQSIENIVKDCYECNKLKNNVEKTETHIWEKADYPFERVHVDYAGPFNGGYYFILVDSFSKWPEIHFVKNTTADTTIELCRNIFATFGLPKILVSDNGSNFTSFKFKQFLQENGILHKLTAPYHPATNGQAERLFGVLIGLLLFAISYSTNSPCKKTQYQCDDGDCIEVTKFCNSVKDCKDGSDEKEDCTPCNMTYYGYVGITYEIEIKRPSETQIPFVCFLNFTAGGGALGELVQLSFESFSVGTFESFMSSGCPDGAVSIREANRPSTGGEWCGSAWGYSVYYSETPSVNLTLSLKTIMQQQNSGNKFEFKLSYKFLKLSDARIRYGNSTQRSYRGKLSAGTYCDRILEGCSRRFCRIQSPNYPGIYPRNVSCQYRVRERNVPQGKHALIAVRQANFHYKEHGKFDGGDRGIRTWDQCNMMQDYLEILDGWGQSATTLAHLCSGETIPEIISSGPELLVKFHTSPFGNPFHPLPISYLPGFELEIEIVYVNKESPTYIEHGKKCEFVVTSFDNPSGYLKNPLHSLPPNTTCHYHFRGQPRDIIWISFIKYHVINERLTDFNTGDCNVELQIWDGDITSRNTVPLMGQFCKDDKPRLCDHTLLKNSSRITRPCGLTESYVSTNSDLTVSHSIKYGSVLYPVNFVMRYEFVDLSQEGIQMSKNPCDRLFRSPSGRFYSPKITFLFGRGGKEDLICTYQFESTEQQRLKITFNKAQFGSKTCHSFYDQDANRWECKSQKSDVGVAYIQISEFPWKDIELQRDCLCHNISEPFTVVTKTSTKVVIKFVVQKMKIIEDYNNYFFDANFEFVPNDNNCFNPWNNRRLKGSSGEITIRNGENSSDKSEGLVYKNQSVRYCLQQPWLIEPEEDGNFIYLKIKGSKKRDTRLCPSKNRILVYPAGKSEIVHVICPHYEDTDDVVEMFSEGWIFYSYKKTQNKNSRSFIIEFARKESGNFAVTWMEVSKNPALALPTSMLMLAPPECPHSCPELGACISSDLWCDGLRHCPSGSDEQESNCSIQGGFPTAYLNSAALSAVAVTALTLVIIAAFYAFRHWRQEQKNVMVSVTEHTFLEFKSGFC